ncbi:hypothetical protein F443_13590 [Phytophthora nicotianae P1569]|uniref:Mitochondrial cardiolipin hydrolase n=1 Tax=Phytophthora nicotianae P1569 TaxID=1317065 RepID=V9ERL9_PHYNI|nr:hypothetical protein F443_13590 [Phytophthora nicotianae P1569]
MPEPLTPEQQQHVVWCILHSPRFRFVSSGKLNWTALSKQLKFDRRMCMTAWHKYQEQHGLADIPAVQPFPNNNMREANQPTCGHAITPPAVSVPVSPPQEQPRPTPTPISVGVERIPTESLTLEEIQDKICSQMDQTKQRAWAAYSEFSNGVLARKLVQLNKRGIDVRVFLHSELATLKASAWAIYILRMGGVQVHVFNQDGSFVWKAMILDDVLMLGSADMTIAAFQDNIEDLWFMTGAFVEEKYTETYKRRWDTLSEEFTKRFVLVKDPVTAEFDVRIIASIEDDCVLHPHLSTP